MKKGIFIALLLCLTMAVGAQGFRGILKPVTVDQIQTVPGAKAGTGAWFFRVNATVTAMTINPMFGEDGKFMGLGSAALSKVGTGVSYAHYVASGEEAVNNYSVNGLLLLPTDGTTNVALAITGSIFNINCGLGYNFVKHSPFTHNLFGLFGVQLAF